MLSVSSFFFLLPGGGIVRDVTLTVGKADHHKPECQQHTVATVC